MKGFTKKLPILILALIELLIGGMLFFIPEIFTEILLMAFGIVLIVIGIFMLIGYFNKRSKLESNAFNLTMSIVLMLVGLLIACFANKILELLAIPIIIYAAVLVIFGIFKIGFYFDMKRASAPVTLIVIISGIVSIVAGAVIACRPLQAMHVFWMVIGIVHMVEALADIVGLFLLPKHEKPAEINASDTDTQE